MHDESILMVDDDEVVLETLTDALQSAGYRVTGCGNGLEAVAAAGQRGFDLIIADIRMPGLDGLAALEKIRQVLPHLRSIVITGYAAEADSIRALRLGVGDYLRKPFHLDEFLAAVARQLGLGRAEKRRLARERTLGRSLVWALEGLAGGSESALAQSRLAYRTAGELGLEEQPCEEIQLAMLGRLLRDRRGLGASVQRLIQELESDEAITSLGARIGRAVLAGRSDSEVVEQALARARRPGEAVGDSARRGLLYLARTLEAAQPAAAQSAYETLSQGQGQEVVEAYLGFMRLNRNKPELAAGHLKRAMAEARARNPAILAAAALEVGNFLMELGRPQLAREHFQEALAAARELGLTVIEAVCRLGVGQAEPSALAELMKPEHRGQRLAAARWLVPFLATTPGGEALLVQLARECPAEFARSFGESDGLVAVRALAASGHPKAGETLTWLAANASGPVRMAAEKALAGERRPPLLRIFTLGQFAVYRGEELVDDKALRGQRGRFLLAWLASVPGPVSVDRIMDEFWPDDAEAGRNNLNNTVSGLRKALRPAGWPDSVDYLVRSGSTLELNRALPIWVDAVELLSLQDRRQAATLYRGPFLESCYMDWAAALRERLESTARRCLAEFLDELAGAQRYAEMLDSASRLLELDPCCQQTHAHLMQAYLHLKRPEAAVRQFEICQKVLQRELGMEPSLALLELHQRARLSLA